MNDTKHAKTKRIGFGSKLVFLFASLIIFFLWALPEIGSKILINNSYYGLANSRIFSNTYIECDEKEFEKTNGSFLGIYPYEAIIYNGCLSPNKNGDSRGYIKIEVRKPHTFIRNFMEFSGIKKFETKYYRIFKVGIFKNE